MLVISNFRNETNRRLCERLVTSCALWGIDTSTEWAADTGDCLKQLHQKPLQLIRKMEDLDRDFVWIDPWAEVVRMPVLLENSYCDIAAYKAGDFWWSGTMLIRNTLIAKDVLCAWADMNEQYPEDGDRNLTRAIKLVEPEMLQLPETYCWLAKTFPVVWPKGQPVISHHPEETLGCLPQVT